MLELVTLIGPVAGAIANALAQYNEAHKRNQLTRMTEDAALALASSMSALAQLQAAAATGQPVVLDTLSMHPTFRSVLDAKLAEAGLPPL